MKAAVTSDRRPRLAVGVWLGGLASLLHVFTASDTYGIFRDELYYLANARHLGLGYVEHPPMIGWITWVARGLFGDSQIALRMFPALAAGATVLLGCRIAREMGGGRLAELVAGLTTALAPVYVGNFGYLSMNAFDILFWTAAILIATRLLSTGDLRWWLPFGLVAGIGLQNKISVLFLGFGLIAGLLLERDRRHFASRWLWLGGAVAAALFLPYVLWQWAHDWAILEFMSRATQFKNLPLSPLEFLSAQALQMNPFVAPLGVAGLAFLLFSRQGRSFRPLAWAALVILALMVTQRAKPYYYAPTFPIFLAAGGVAIEQWTACRGRAWLRPAVPTVVVLTGLALAPLAKPVLAVEDFVRYQSALGLGPRTSERHELERLPQFFADRLGWPELAETVADIYRALPAGDRAVACIFGQNYGQAGAIDFYGPALGLPRAISGHNSYWWWGPGDCSGELVIIMGGDREDHAAVFEEVELATIYTCRDCMPYENNKPIWICRNSRLTIEEIWPRVRHYD